MDHERYPYYFNEPGTPVRADHLEHAGEAFAAVAVGIWSGLRRIVSVFSGQEAKPAR